MHRREREVGRKGGREGGRGSCCEFNWKECNSCSVIVKPQTCFSYKCKHTAQDILNGIGPNKLLHVLTDALSACLCECSLRKLSLQHDIPNSGGGIMGWPQVVLMDVHSNGAELTIANECLGTGIVFR